MTLPWICNADCVRGGPHALAVRGHPQPPGQPRGHPQATLHVRTPAERGDGPGGAGEVGLLSPDLWRRLLQYLSQRRVRDFPQRFILRIKLDLARLPGEGSGLSFQRVQAFCSCVGLQISKKGDDGLFVYLPDESVCLHPGVGPPTCSSTAEGRPATTCGWPTARS